jgi:hypothetical protein
MCPRLPCQMFHAGYRSALPAWCRHRGRPALIRLLTVPFRRPVRVETLITAIVIIAALYAAFHLGAGHELSAASPATA